MIKVHVKTSILGILSLLFNSKRDARFIVILRLILGIVEISLYDDKIILSRFVEGRIDF